jgi:Rrf2 family protein
LHHKHEGGCAREIADRFDLSRAFVANILKELCHKGYVSSHRGVKGGYVLQRPAEEIPLVELIEALDDPFHFAECNEPVGGDGCHLMHLCPLKGAIAEIHQRIREMLQTLTLADIFRGAAPEKELLSLSIPNVTA